MKHQTYIVIAIVALSGMISACSETDNYQADEKTQSTTVKGIALSLESIQTTNKAVTRASVSGYSINTSTDPTNTALELRTDWKLDFALFYMKDKTRTKYNAGSFVGGSYDNSEGFKAWKPVPTESTSTWYFPNYFNPTTDLLIYPNTTDTTIVKLDQSTRDKLLLQDILFKVKEPIQIAHNIIYGNSNTKITVNHKRAILDFIVSDVVHNDIASVTVKKTRPKNTHLIR